MSYTVKELSKISGVTPRALRWYDEIGILKPAYYGENGYRYYEEKQLLLLQQILFYRELDFSLDEIKQILSGKDFEIVSSLLSQKEKLMQRLDKTDQLIKTIDKTLSHIRGKSTMKKEEFYYGVDSEKQREYEQYLIDNEICDEESINDAREYYQNMAPTEFNAFQKDIKRIHEAFTSLIEEGVGPESEEAQALIKEHHRWITKCWKKAPTKEKYVALAELYQTHPEFIKFYEKFHPDLLDYLSKGMVIFAQTLRD